MSSGNKIDKMKISNRIDADEYERALETGSEQIKTTALRPWKQYEKILFRIGLIFLVAICIPNNPEWFKLVLNIDWSSLNYRDLYDIARFGSGINFFGDSFLGKSLGGYANWLITAIAAINAGFLWTVVVRLLRKDREEYNTLYYWLRTLVRYRAGIGIIGFGFTKVFPVQMPFPSLGMLNADFGDITAQKIYWLSVGIAPWYQIFAGVVEVGAGTLLLFRRTTTLGSVLLFAALGDIVIVNVAYSGGVHVYSSYFVLLAAFLLIADVPKIYKLFIKEEFTVPVNYYPAFSKVWQRWARIGIKTVTILIFLPLFFYLQYINWRYDPYKLPSAAGVKELRGNYTVTEFRLNDKIIPYSPLDSVRWQDVTFEKWPTLTFKVNKPLPLDLSNGGGDSQRDIDRTFEITAIAGGQRAFHYLADEINKTLYLQDKYTPLPIARNRAAGVGGAVGPTWNVKKQNKIIYGGEDDTESEAYDQYNWIPKEALANIGNEVYKINPKAVTTRRIKEYAEPANDEVRKRMVLKYDTLDGQRIILSGTDENNDSLYILLDRIDRKYTLKESSLQPGEY
ncbi:hypothetical protein [Terrimonas sp.]|uniref:hypothetical protein n=1 Tax=Terrimonas sp. TaxID=1914338 RepID=UPI001981DDDC|nr:hypothetical protein [Terrimonas sp.]